MKQKLEKTTKLLPWYLGLSDDLIFFAIINTIWLIEIKHFSITQVTMLTTVSNLFYLLFQIPILKIIQKIGNVKSVQLGTFLLLLSSILLTVMNQYIWFMIATILYELSFVFKNMGDVLLRNNLHYLDQSKEFLILKTKANTIYAVATAFVALFCGFIFKLNVSLPMILGTSICLLTFIMTLFLQECIKEESHISLTEKPTGKKLPQKVTLAFLILVLYGIFYGIVVIGQRNAQTLIQFQLKETLDFEQVTTIMGIIIFLSRICRITSNFLFLKLYNVYKNKVITILSAELFASFFFLLLGYYLDVSLFFKIILMTIGFSFILEVRSPIKTYMQNLILEEFKQHYHQSMITYLEFCRKIGTVLFGAFISYLLSKNTIDISIIALLVGSFFILLSSYSLRACINNPQKK